MPSYNLLKPALAAAACLLLAAPASAFLIAYQVEPAVSNLYDADPTSPAMGTSLGSLSGSLTFDYDGIDTFALIASTVTLSSADYSFDIAGGELHNDGSGTLDFALTGTGPYAQTATITLIGGGPNQASPTQLLVSGDSTPGPESLPGGLGGPGGPGLPPASYVIGINLSAFTIAAPMPEPSAGLAFAVGALVTQAAIRRQRP